MIFTYSQKITYSQLNLPHGTKQKRIMKKLEIKTEILRRNGPVIKPWNQSRGRKGKICEKVGLEPGVKERGSYGW